MEEKDKNNKDVEKQMISGNITRRIKIDFFKFSIIMAVLIIALSVFYYYVIFLPKQHKKEILLNYKAKFQKECENNYYKLSQEYSEDIKTDRLITIRVMEMLCNEIDYKFSPEMYFYCLHGKPFVHTIESYVPLCVDYKIKQIYSNF